MVELVGAVVGTSVVGGSSVVCWVSVVDTSVVDVGESSVVGLVYDIH